MKSSIALDQLQDHIPTKSYGYLRQLISGYGINFRISRPRKTKLGDYRYDPRTRVHSISVNSDLNQYSFLITLVHELAHYRQYSEYKRRSAPHGKEWKIEFQTLMAPLIEEKIFPEEISVHLGQHMINPKATCSDIRLMRLLEPYDETQALRLEDLTDGDLFKINNERVFRREKKLRSRFECVDIRTNRKWFVHALTKVEIVN